MAGRYRLIREIGHGGMGSVWAAEHTVTRAEVALKFLDARLAGRDDMRARFLAEARAAATVDHPNVINVHDVFELDDHTPVMVQERLVGESLADRLDGVEPLDPRDFAAIMLPVVEAVAAAHEAGVVHRDLKPDNVFLAATNGADPNPMVLDFGIAKLLDVEGDEAVVTRTGTMLGTPGYMSPEQGFGEDIIDGRADVWALGVMLYEGFSGIRPVEAENMGKYLKRLMNDAITPLEVLEPDLPAAVHTTVAAMLQVEADDRLTDLSDVADVLAALRDGEALAEPVPRSKPPPVSRAQSSERAPSTASDPPSPWTTRAIGLVLVAAAVGVGLAVAGGGEPQRAVRPQPSATSTALRLNVDDDEVREVGKGLQNVAEMFLERQPVRPKSKASATPDAGAPR